MKQTEFSKQTNLATTLKRNVGCSVVETITVETTKGILEKKTVPKTINSIVKNTTKAACISFISVGAGELITDVLIMANPKIGKAIKGPIKLVASLITGHVVNKTGDTVFKALGDHTEVLAENVSTAILEFAQDSIPVYVS